MKTKREKRKYDLTNDLTTPQWNHCLWYFDHVCCVCGSTLFIEGDHWIARSRGGSSGLDNIVPMCRCCNLEKGASPVMGWLIFKFKSIVMARAITANVEQYFREAREKTQ